MSQAQQCDIEAEFLLPTYHGGQSTASAQDGQLRFSEHLDSLQDSLLDQIWASGSPNKYLLLRLVFREALTAAHRTRLVAVFKKFLEIMHGYEGGRNLWAPAAPYAFGNKIDSATRLLDWSKPILGACTFSPAVLPQPESATAEAQRLYGVFMAVMCTYKPGERDDYCPSATRYVPIYLSGFRENQNQDGSWKMSSGLIARLAEVKAFEVAINTKALEEGGMTDRKWASVMFHEMLHNLGYDHSSNYSDREQFILKAEDVFYACGKD